MHRFRPVVAMITSVLVAIGNVLRIFGAPLAAVGAAASALWTLTRPVRGIVLTIACVIIVLWAAIPVARAMWMLREVQHTVGAAPIIDGIQGTDAVFYANDDSSNPTGAPNYQNNPIPIAGWLYVTKQAAPTVILLPGWKDDRRSMEPYAAFLLKGGLNALLIDLRGTGHSGGEFSLGLNEPMDVKAAIEYLDDPSQHPNVSLTNHHYGVLGVSFGAGVGIAAAGGNGAGYPGAPEVTAVVADSPWATEDKTVDLLNGVSLFGRSLSLPHTVTLFGHVFTFFPGAQWAVDSTIDANLDTRSALAGAENLAPNQALMIIHSVHDSNSTTTAADARELYDAAKVQHKVLWDDAPGGHMGALAADPVAYSQRVMDFLQANLVNAPPSTPSLPVPTGGQQ